MILTVNISEIKTNPNNPRVIKDDKFKKLVKSIQDFPEMLNIRPIVVNSDMIVLGGNMRLKACREAGLKEIPIIYADNLTEEQEKEFIIKDNIGFGEWNWDELEDWNQIDLENWGLDLPEKKEKQEDGEIIFSTELDFESNYIVLKFTTDIDWIYAKGLFELDSTYSMRQNGKPWSRGVGRVVDGIKAIEKIKNEN
jgi:hypothetical protein